MSFIQATDHLLRREKTLPQAITMTGLENGPDPNYPQPFFILDS